jgi:hypothetical protein
VFLDFAPLRCAWRAVRRSRERADFWKRLLTYRRHSRPTLRRAIAAHAGRLDVYLLPTPRAVRRFVTEIASAGPGILSDDASFVGLTNPGDQPP